MAETRLCTYNRQATLTLLEVFRYLIEESDLTAVISIQRNYVSMQIAGGEHATIRLDWTEQLNSPQPEYFKRSFDILHPVLTHLGLTHKEASAKLKNLIAPDYVQTNKI